MRKRELRGLPVFRNKRDIFKGLKLLYDNSNHNSLTLSSKQLEEFPTIKLTDDFKCVEGWVVSGIRWEGIPVSSILSKMSLTPQVRWFLFGSGNFTCLLSKKRASEGTTLLATRMNGRRLTVPHGGPVRLVFKGQKCYENIKSVDRIIALERPAKTTAKRIAMSRI
ncbi:MAG: molybdopterin-dependent oxidoreductase [archaeon]|nr:molybdopterin-dependent oxidoreductase [archaeon]